MSDCWESIRMALCGLEDVGVKELEPLARHTSFRIGGPARFWIEPGTIDALARAMALISNSGIPWIPIGGGTNILFADEGVYRGVVISTRALQSLKIEGNTVRADAGVPLSRLVARTVRAGLSGFAELAGIPGTSGGAIAGNAGVPGQDVFTHLHGLNLIESNGRLSWIPKEEIDYGYRRCLLPAGSVIGQVKWELPAAPMKSLMEIARAAVATRSSSQPLGYPSAGSVFKNPEGTSAGRLLDEAGLKGSRSGGAVISPSHANWIILDGPATAKDVLDLIERARHIILETNGIALETEIRIVRSGENESC